MGGCAAAAPPWPVSSRGRGRAHAARCALDTVSTRRDCAALTLRGAGADSTDDQRFYLGVEKAVLFNTAEEGLTEDEAEQRLLKFGKNQLPEKEDNKLVKLALEFVQPMPLMIWAAIFIEARRPRPPRALACLRPRSRPRRAWRATCLRGVHELTTLYNVRTHRGWRRLCST